MLNESISLPKNERDDPRYLNYLLLRTLFEICESANAPSDISRTVERIADLHAYDIGPKLRKEAFLVSKDFASKILDSYELNFDDEDEREYGNDQWDDGLVDIDQANCHKTLWQEAIEEKSCVKINYVSDTSGYAVRTVKPTGVRGPYGEGYCYLRKAERVFRFDRILNMEPVKDRKKK